VRSGRNFTILSIVASCPDAAASIVASARAQWLNDQVVALTDAWAKVKLASHSPAILITKRSGEVSELRRDGGDCKVALLSDFRKSVNDQTVTPEALGKQRLDRGCAQPRLRRFTGKHPWNGNGGCHGTLAA